MIQNKTYLAEQEECNRARRTMRIDIPNQTSSMVIAGALKFMVADPDGVDPDPDRIVKKRLDFDTSPSE